MPNVLGNYVVYKQLGLCSKRALGMVLIAAAVCMIGLFAGLTLAAIPDAERWLLGIIAGLFIHIPLVDIVSLFNSPGRSRPKPGTFSITSNFMKGNSNWKF